MLLKTQFFCKTHKFHILEILCMKSDHFRPSCIIIKPDLFIGTFRVSVNWYHKFCKISKLQKWEIILKKEIIISSSHAINFILKLYLLNIKSLNRISVIFLSICFGKGVHITPEIRKLINKIIISQIDHHHLNFVKT
jgi:hypothetical protein